MRTQPIFDGWIIIQPKPTIKKPLIVMKKISFKSFYLTPNKRMGVSMINILKDNLGKKVGHINTFQTDFISTTNKTGFNGYTFKLNIINDNVYLSVMFHNIEFNICNWNIDTIVSSMKSKNPNNRFITKTLVSNLLLNGKLGVKFNVSKTKDHGTLWSVKQ
jgi:hypothetical protein